MNDEIDAYELLKDQKSNVIITVDLSKSIQ